MRPGVYAIAAMLFGGLMATAGDEKPTAEKSTGTAAGIEIGTRTCRVVVVRVDRTPWKTDRTVVRFEKTVGLNFARAVAESGTLADADIQKAVGEVTRMTAVLEKEHGLSKEQIHIATGGSLERVAGVDDLRAAVAKATGRPVEAFTVEREALYSMKGMMPDEYMKGAWYGDIGSGSVKLGSYKAEGQTSLPEFRSVTLPGVGAFRERITKRAEADKVSFDAAAEAERKVLVKEFKQAAEANPSLVNRDDALVTGGVVWALASLVKPEEADAAYVPVTAADIARLREFLLESPDKVPAPDLSGIRWEALRKTAEDEAKRVADTFSRESLLAGAEILSAMSEAFRMHKQRVYFPRQGGHAWIATFAAEQLTGNKVTLK